jgi:rhamnosyltransferase
MNESICAVIISYNDFDSLEKTVEHVLPQVDKVLIIDNKSEDDIRQRIITQFNIDKIELFLNDENNGIAKAYNQAVDYCKNENYEYIFTLDQDSLIEPQCINNLLKVFEEKDDAYIVVPRRVENWEDTINSAEDYIVEKKYAISSGNLLRISTYDKVGNYNEKLFIDSVDFDFSLRIRNLGGKIYECKKTRMLHRLGELYYKKIMGVRVKFFYHNNIRTYYNYRNSVYILRTFFTSNFIFCIKRVIILSYETVLNLKFNPDKRGFKSSMKEGIKDGINNAYGKKSWN